MVYEALTGQLPFTGSVMQILMAKQRQSPPRPSALEPEVPEDLDTLCLALLQKEPRKRPSGRDVLRWMGAPAERTKAAGRADRTAASVASPPFVGRRRQLQALQDAVRASAEGRTVAVLVHGGSGVGKTALVLRFLDDLMVAEPERVVLAGRCYQHESVPFKALDTLVDSLSRTLKSLPQEEAERLLPEDILALARLFPVLERVPAVSGASRSVLDIPDSRELRRRAAAALRELLGRLARRTPLVLFVDDLHWGDPDSGALFHELLRPPDPPPLTLIACFRGEEALSSPLLRSLFSSELSRTAVEVREIALSDLSQEESEEVASTLLAGLAADEDEVARLAALVSRESRGNPFFLDALVQLARRLPAEDLAGALEEATLEGVLAAHRERLPASAERLLETLAVAGRPLPLEVAGQAAGVEGDASAALAALRAGRLVRLRSAAEEETLELYHERLRPLALKSLDGPMQSFYHRRLALALEASGQEDTEALAIHYREAGDPERAGRLAAEAADRAVQALAFDNAARLYRMALDLEASGSPEVRSSLLERLGSSLANAGRGAEAAQVYLGAADGAKAAVALELRRRAAEQLLISGRIDKGLATVRHVLATIGMELPPTPHSAVFSLLRRRARLKLRGYGFKERDSTQISPEVLIRIDTCWSVSVGLGIVDTIRGMDFSTRSLLLALKTGEPYRVARALAIEVGYSATGGSKTRRRTAKLQAAARELAERVNHPHAQGLVTMTSGVAAFLEGRWRPALDDLDQAETLLRERCTGVSWEIDTTMLFQMRSLLMAGEWAELARRMPGRLKDAQVRGDLYGETCLRTRACWVVWLMRDEPRLAREDLQAAIRRWSDQGFHLQHYWYLTGMVETALYRGDADAAWSILQELWPALAGSLLLRIQFTRTEALSLRGRAALALLAADGAAGDADAHRQATRILRRDVKALSKEAVPWARPLASLLQAGRESLQGNPTRTQELLSRAASGFDEAHMKLHAAAARRALADAATSEATDAVFTGEGIRNPDAVAAVLAPGRWRA